MSSPPKAPPSDAERELADLEYKGRRLEENLAGLQKHERHLKSQIERHETARAAANAAVAKLPKDADAVTVHAAKSAAIGVELNLGRLREQLAQLQPELHETPALIKENAKAQKELTR